jgi:hypothetical protein
VVEYRPVHTAEGLRGEAERCFRLAADASEKRIRDELVAYGKELMERAAKMEAMQSATANAAHEHKG